MRVDFVGILPIVEKIVIEDGVTISITDNKLFAKW